MFNLGDDSELDSFSREAAGKYSPPGEPNWEKLSAELDKVLPVEEKKKRFVFFWWLLPVLLIGGAVSYWLTLKNQPPQSATTTKIVDSKKSVSSESPTDVASKKTDNGEAVVTTPSPKQTIEPNNSVIQKETSNTATTKLTDESVKTPEKNPAHKKSSILLSSSAKGIASQKTQQISSQKTVEAVNDNDPKSTGKSFSTNDQSITVQQDNISNQTNNKVNLITEKTADSGTQPIIARKEESQETKNNTEPATPAITESTNNTDKKLIPATKGKGFSYSFLAGVDKSTVKFSYGYNPGYNFGMMGGYHFNSTLSVHTGLIYTRKQYKMEGADFTAPKGTPISYYKLDLVDGYCKMWEVPLLFRYTVPKANGNSFFLSAGLSSYFMTSENYNYYYKYLGTPVVKNSSYNSTDTHILSIVHLSAGFSKPVGKNWDLQMEPYAKIPLGGVGFGSIELSSFGINFSVQHRQPSKK